MEKETRRTLKLLNEIEKDQNISQRILSGRMNIALGLTNACIKRCVKKGYIKITTIPKNRIKYLITPRGFAEKARLTYEYLEYTIHFYKEARARIRDSFHLLAESGTQKIIFYGAGEVAEISYISLQETNLTLAGVLDDFKYDRKFFGFTIMKREKLNDLSYDKVVVTSFNSSEDIYKSLLNDNINKEKIFLLR